MSTNYNYSKPTWLISIVLLLALVLPGCIPAIPVKVEVGPTTRPAIDRALEVIDNGIHDIQQNSEVWQAVLQRVADQLPQEIDETIRIDAQSLATRSIAVAGVELRCNIDFLGVRAIQSLQRLKAEVLGQNPPLLSPSFCQVDPPSIDLKVSPEKWSTAILYGYDLDHTDTAGRLLQIWLLDSQGNSTLLPESRIGRTTHYQITLNLGDMARQLYTSQVNKIVFSWDNSSEGYPQIVVVPWEAHRQTVTVPIGDTSFQPPHIGNGDGDFYINDSNPSRVRVCGQIQIDDWAVQNQAYMLAEELKPDHTMVEGWSGWKTAYQAPFGYRIVDVTPYMASCDDTKTIVTGEYPIKYGHLAGEVVSRFEVWVDHGGDEAGTWSRVLVQWQPLDITIEEAKPEWLR